MLGTQVPLQNPPPVETRLSGGSPLLKDTTTDPEFTELPQSSTTWTITELGHAAGVLKPAAMVVKSGRSLVAPQAGTAAAKSVSVVKFEDSIAPGDTTSSRSTVCELPSPKASCI